MLFRSRHRIACLFYATAPQNCEAAETLIMPKDKALYAQRLYKTLYSLDGLGLEAIWLEYPPNGEQWRDVNDRLARAAAIP